MIPLIAVGPRMRLNLPNKLTLIRIFLAPLLVVVLLTPPWATAEIKSQLQGMDSVEWLGDLAVWFSEWRDFVGVLIFLTAALTDWLDGYLARSRGQVTTLGALLDPIADKLLTGSAFIALVELQLAPAWMVVVIVGREFAVSGLRSIAATQGVVISASIWGKYKTVVQVIAITSLILTDFLQRYHMGQLGRAMLWLVMVLAIISMTHYFVHFVRCVDLDSRA